MPAIDDIAKAQLALMESKGLRRILKETAPQAGVRVQRGGRELISFSGNDYFGLSQDVRVIHAAGEALERYGAGAGASRLVTGNIPLYGELEAALAEYKATEAACVFGSGYLANIGVITTLVGKADLIIADKYSHACMLDGAQLSGATLVRFAHNNIEHCRLLLESYRTEHQNCLIMTETVFSMDGDRAPVVELAALAREFDAWLLTDDAHGLGFSEHKRNGHGNRAADIQIGTLSKGAGSYGGYVCASQAVIEWLHTAARSLIFSTALPPATLAASIASLDILRNEPQRMQKALENARLFTKYLSLPQAQSLIVPVVLGEVERALEASLMLEEAGFLVAAIRPPTVPQASARLRFTFSSVHEKADIERAAHVLKQGDFA